MDLSPRKVEKALEAIDFLSSLPGTSGGSTPSTSLVPRPSYQGVPVRGPGNNGPPMRLIKTARYA